MVDCGGYESSGMAVYGFVSCRGLNLIAIVDGMNPQQTISEDASIPKSLGGETMSPEDANQQSLAAGPVSAELSPA